MKIMIPSGSTASVDRTGSANHYPKHLREGMVVFIDDGCIEFDDEADALQMAKMILWRLGESYDGTGKDKEKPQ
jgi:hypothetical protein